MLASGQRGAKEGRYILLQSNVGQEKMLEKGEKLSLWTGIEIICLFWDGVWDRAMLW